MTARSVFRKQETRAVQYGPERSRGEVEYKAAEAQTKRRPRYSDARNSVATSTHVLSTNARNSEARVRQAKLRWITRTRTCTVGQHGIKIRPRVKRKPQRCVTLPLSLSLTLSLCLRISRHRRRKKRKINNKNSRHFSAMRRRDSSIFLKHPDDRMERK